MDTLSGWTAGGRPSDRLCARAGLCASRSEPCQHSDLRGRQVCIPAGDPLTTLPVPKATLGRHFDFLLRVGEVVARDESAGVVGAEDALAGWEGLLVEGDRLVGLPGCAVGVGEVVARDESAGVV